MKQEFKTMHGNEYSTPQAVFNYFNKIYNFTHDLSASDLNYKCNNSLTKDSHLTYAILWLNPPYSPLRPWIEKAQKGNTKDSVLLVFNDDVVRGASSWLSRSELLKETL